MQRRKLRCGGFSFVSEPHNAGKRGKTAKLTAVADLFDSIGGMALDRFGVKFLNLQTILRFTSRQRRYGHAPERRAYAPSGCRSVRKNQIGLGINFSLRMKT